MPYLEWFVKRVKMCDVSCLRLTEKPRILLYSGGKSASHMMQMWIGSLEDSGVSLVVVVRSLRSYKYIKRNWPYVPVALARRRCDLVDVIAALPSLRAALYPGNSVKNNHLLRLNYLNHIFIGHGDSDKESSANKCLRAYDEIWVAGQAHIDRFKNTGVDFGHLRYVKVGRPSLLPVIREVERRLAERQRALPKCLTVLYLPTWEGGDEGSNYSSLEDARKFLSTLTCLGKNASILIKVHPRTGERNFALANADSRLLSVLRKDGFCGKLIERTEPLHEHLIRANVFICDCSSIITDCLAVDAPIFVYRSQGEHLRFTQSDMPPEHFAYVFSDAREFEEKFEAFMKEGDTLATQRAEARQYLLGIDETRANRFSMELRRVANLNSEPDFN